MRKLAIILFLLCSAFSYSAGVTTSGVSSGPVTDTTAPTISSPLPSGEQTCTSDPRTVSLQITTNENATCKYDTSDTTYDLMANTFGTTGGTTHSQTSGDLDCDDSYTYYCRCADGSGNKNSSSTQISFSIAAAAGCAGGSDGVIGIGTVTTNYPYYDGEGTNTFYYTAFTPTEDGSVTYGHVSVYSVGLSYRIVVRANDGTLLGYGPEHEGTNTSDPDVDTAHDSLTEASPGSLCLASGTTYKVGVWIEADSYASCQVIDGTTGVYRASLAAYNTSWNGTATATVEAAGDLRITLNNSAGSF